MTTSAIIGNCEDSRYLDATNLEAVLERRVRGSLDGVERNLTLSQDGRLAPALAHAKHLVDDIERLKKLHDAIQEAHWAWEDVQRNRSQANLDFLENRLIALLIVRRDVEVQIRPVGTTIR